MIADGPELVITSQGKDLEMITKRVRKTATECSVEVTQGNELLVCIKGKRTPWQWHARM